MENKSSKEYKWIGDVEKIYTYINAMSIFTKKTLCIICVCNSFIILCQFIDQLLSDWIILFVHLSYINSMLTFIFFLIIKRPKHLEYV